ncbi:MAG: hypothetical protein V4541_12635 [Bacteroidota bacterium]
MDYSIKAKILQHKTDVSNVHPVLIGIYSLLFAQQPEGQNANTIIKGIQQKLKVTEKGKPGTKTWRALHQLITGNEDVDFNKKEFIVDPHNEAVLSTLNKEIAPFAKELIRLTTAQDIHIRLMNGSQNGGLSAFGLTFDIGIFDQSIGGTYHYNGNLLRYANVARLGESIGLTWAGNLKTSTNLSHFELRPAWALVMEDKEMIKELHHRKKTGLSLLAIL